MPVGSFPGLRPPVAIFIFRRPDVTRELMERVAEARPSRLFIVADGPSPERPGEVELCEATRAVAEAVRWPCEISRNYADVNLGFKRRVSSGLDWVFAHTEEAIILEDDCVPHPSFFQFCEELLERYRLDPRVHMITGTNVLPRGAVGLDSSYFFSRSHHTWGWASWARAWRHYDIDMRVWPRLRDEGWLDDYLPEEPMVRVAKFIMEETYLEHLLTWEFQWALAGWVTDALCATPATNLVSNIGFGEGAASFVDPNNPMANRPTVGMTFPLRHPRGVEVDESLELESWATSYPTYFDADGPGGVGGAGRRILRALQSLLTARLKRS